MHQPRIGYNAKARGSIAGGKKKGNQKQRRGQGDEGDRDGGPNAPIYIPKSEEEKERQRKERVKQEVSSIIVEWIEFGC